MLFPIIKSHLTGSPLEIFLRSGMRGMLASVFLLVTISSCLFSFMTWVLVEVISVVELTSNLTLEGISIMFLEWFYNYVPGWLGLLGTIPLRFLGFALKYMDPDLPYTLQKVRSWNLGKRTCKGGGCFYVFRSHHWELKWMSQTDSQLDHKYLSVASSVPEKGDRMINKTDAVPALGRL